MNAFLNPANTLPYLKNYIFDTNRIDIKDKKYIEKYRNKSFRKILQYANQVPLYQEKFKKHNIDIKKINDLKDIQKLPFINRQDIGKHFPDGVVPKNFNKEKGMVLCTGGTSGKYCCNSGSDPVCLYTDFKTLLRGSLISQRVNNYHNINIRKSKIVHIGNYNPFKFDEVFDTHVLSQIKPFFPLKNYKSIHASNKTQEIIEQLNNFKPDVIISYPAIYQDLAYLKNKGFGQHIQPKVLLVGGAMLDNYTKTYVEHAFGSNLYNTYASCEMGAEIAFECQHRNWHIHSDFFHLEAVDKDNNIVNPGERGRLVITRLWGSATPIIRYTGMQDWITLSEDKTCTCGLKSPIFGRPVEGRIFSNILLPNGRVYPPSEFLFITKVLTDLNTFKIKKYQIIQKTLDEIEILLVVDEDLRQTPPSLELISEKIKKTYEEKVGSDVKITIKEVKQIENDKDSGKPAPLVLSYVNENCDVNN